MDKISRSLIIFIISIVLFLGSIVTVFATIEQRDFYLRGYANPTKTLELPYRLPRLGINADLTQYNADELSNHLDKMSAIGITWVRQIVTDRQDWSVWDNIISALSEYPQLELIPVLIGSTTDIDDFSEFVTDFTNQYSNSITYYQIWDEPNIQAGWFDNNPNPTHYLALLQSAYTTIHQIDPDAYVIAAALAPTVETGPQNISDHLYLRQLYQLGLKDYSDAIAGKPYGFDTSPNDRVVRADQLTYSRFIMLREIMLEYDDGQKALWASNWGWNSLGEDWTGAQSIWGQVDQDKQIDYTLDALQRAESEWPWLGGFILDNWQIDKQDHTNPRWGFSLLSHNDEEKPLYKTLEAYYHDQPLNAQTGLYPANNPYTKYAGVWTFNQLGADIGWVQDSQIEFNFYGNMVSLITRQDDYVTNLYVTVDGQPANQLPRDSNNNAYLLLKSPQLSPEIINKPLSKGLITTSHQLHIVADELIPDETILRWSIVGFGVGTDDLAVPFERQIVASSVASFFSLIAVMVSATQINLSPVFNLWNRFSDILQMLIAFLISAIVMLSMLITWHDGYPQFFRRESIQIFLGFITAGLVYWNGFHLPITLILLGFLLLIVYNNLRIGVLLIIFWTPFFLFPVELYRFAFPMVEVMVIVTFGAWLLKMGTDIAKTRKLPTITLHIIDYIILIWLISGLFGLWVSDLKYVAMTDFRTLYVQPIIFYIIARTINKDQRFIYQMVSALVISSFIISLIGLYQLLTGVFIQAEGGSIRLASVYGSPNNAALFLERSLPFVGAVLLLVPIKQRWLKLTTILIFVVVGLALILTLSAGALFLAIPACTLTILLLVYGKRSFKYLIPLGLIFSIGFIFALQSPRFERFLDLTSGTNFYRVRVWQSASQMVEDYPITGIGLDQFLYKYRGEYILPDAWQEPELSHPHNIVFDFWLRSGVIGILFLIFAIVGIIKVLRQYLQQANQQSFPIIIGCIGALVSLISHGLVDNSIYVIDLAYVFSLILILLTSIGSMNIIYTIHQGETL